MSETKIFRKKDLDLESVNGMKIIGLVNVSFSDKLGAFHTSCDTIVTEEKARLKKWWVRQDLNL